MYLIGAFFARPDRRDREGVTGLPNRSENDYRGAGDLHRPAAVRTVQPERPDPDKVQKPSDMACAKFPSTTFFSGDFSDLAYQPGLL